MEYEAMRAIEERRRYENSPAYLEKVAIEKMKNQRVRDGPSRNSAMMRMQRSLAVVHDPDRLKTLLDQIPKEPWVSAEIAMDRLQGAVQTHQAQGTDSSPSEIASQFIDEYK